MNDFREILEAKDFTVNLDDWQEDFGDYFTGSAGVLSGNVKMSKLRKALHKHIDIWLDKVEESEEE